MDIDLYADQLLTEAHSLAPLPTAVVHPCSEEALAGAIEAAQAGLIQPLLVAPKAKLETLASGMGISLADYEVVDVEHSHDSAAKSVSLVREGRARALMKGSLHTDELLHAVLKRDTGLRTERVLSHAFWVVSRNYPKPLLITDAAINIYPGLMEKRDICQNAINLAHSMGIEQPKVAILSAVETVSPKIQATIDAASLCKMADRGQIVGGILDGPLAFDNAISKLAARTKGIHSAVAGEPDILLMPDLEAGNLLAKQMIFLGGAAAAGLILGARVPIILTSRADSVLTRKLSCALASINQAHELGGKTNG